MSHQISFIMITKNAAATIQETLEALKNWPHIVILDTGSTDDTCKIIRSYPHILLFEAPFEGFGAARNLATSHAQTPWVFHIDADEVPQKALLDELINLHLDKNTCFSVLRDNYFLGKLMKGCSGWTHDIVVRLYCSSSTRYSDDLVHEKVITDNMDVIKLKGTLKHTPYQSFKHMIDKMNHYSDLFVKNTHKKASSWSPFTHAIFAFIKSYVFKKGFTQGLRGYILSKYIADTAFYKYLKLLAAQKKL